MHSGTCGPGPVLTLLDPCVVLTFAVPTFDWMRVARDLIESYIDCTLGPDMGYVTQVPDASMSCRAGGTV
jgi:hypothetical protein